MTLTGTAEENLRVIRSLMERATVYRTISVPGAVLGGGLSLAACGIQRWTGHFSTGLGFLALWGAVLVLTALGNGLLIWREAQKSRGRFFSPAFKTALRGLLPSLLVAAGFTALGLWKVPQAVVPVWILFYGLGLLGTQHFAPRSLVVLGWAFVATPFLLLLICLFHFEWLNILFLKNGDALGASLLMALTFGLFHLVYALCVHLSLRRERAS